MTKYYAICTWTEPDTEKVEWDSLTSEVFASYEDAKKFIDSIDVDWRRCDPRGVPYFPKPVTEEVYNEKLKKDEEALDR